MLLRLISETTGQIWFDGVICDHCHLLRYDNVWWNRIVYIIVIIRNSETIEWIL